MMKKNLEKHLLIKQQLYNKCCEFVENKLDSIRKTIDQIQESLSTETKSSAGDKHETGRAMLQLEREKVGQQLAETQKLKQVLSKIDSSSISEKVSLGSLIYTSQNNYFISISAGEFQIKDDLFYAISMNTPIAQILFGKRVNEQVVFRQELITICSII